MDVAYVNPFVISTIDTFKTMLNIDVRNSPVQLKDEKNFPYDVSGIIGLSGEAQGSICMSFPKIMALKVVSKLLGAEIKIVGAEVADGIGEIANIVAGNAKQHLNKFSISISLPKVVIGKGHFLAKQQNIPTIVVPFTCVIGTFGMEVSLKTPDPKR